MIISRLFMSLTDNMSSWPLINVSNINAHTSTLTPRTNRPQCILYHSSRHRRYCMNRLNARYSHWCAVCFVLFGFVFTNNCWVEKTIYEEAEWHLLFVWWWKITLDENDSSSLKPFVQSVWISMTRNRSSTMAKSFHWRGVNEGWKDP